MSTPSTNEELRHPSDLLRRMLTWVVDELRWFVRVVASAADRFYWDDGFSRAASLAYTTLLSLVPLMALVFALLGSFAASSEHLPGVRSFVFRQFVPSTAAAETVLQNLSRFSEAIGGLNALVLVFVVFTVILLINSIENSLNSVWQVYESRSIANRLAIFCAIIVIGPVLAVSAYYFTRFRIEPLLFQIEHATYITSIYQTLLPFLIDFAAFASLYYLVPRAPVRFRSAVFGAFLAALLFGFAKGGFALYVERIASYDKIYNALASVPIFLVWLYVAWSIVLIGAECSFQSQYLPKRGKVWKRSILSVGDASMMLAVQALVMVSRAFRNGTKLPSDIEVAEALGCSSVVLKPVLGLLERAGILARGDSRDMPLMLLRDPSTVSLEEVRLALFGTRTALHFSSEMSVLFGSFCRATSEPSSQAMRVTTLADVVNAQEAALLPLLSATSSRAVRAKDVE